MTEMQTRATKEALLQPRAGIETEDVMVDGVGLVTVRGLSRFEMVKVFGLEGKRLEQEQCAVSFGMVDPAMSKSDVAAWQKAGMAAELNNVADTINRLSGIGKGADKSLVSGDGEQPDA